MARTRMIKPEFFRSRSLARVSRDARLTFVGLWTEADSAGRGVADPRILKGSIWPIEDDITADVVAVHLRELEADHIQLYEVDGECYYVIVNWEKHQSSAYRTGAHQHPPPTTSDTSGTLSAIVQPASSAVQSAGETVPINEGKGREVLARIHEQPKPKPVTPPSAATKNEFEIFWKAYPKRLARKDAERAFAKARKSAELHEILAAIKPIRRQWGDPKQRQFIPYPASWLNGERWNDETAASAEQGVQVVNGVRMLTGPVVM